MIPSDEAVIKLVTLVPVIVLGIIGNLLLINIIARNRALQTPTNLILANMVTADTITLLFCPVMFICRDFYQNFMLGGIGCNMEGYLQGKICIMNNQQRTTLFGKLQIFFASHTRNSKLIMNLSTYLLIFIHSNFLV